MPRQNGPGAPRKIGPGTEARRVFLEVFAKTMRWFESAEAAGVHYETVRLEMQRDPVFLNQIKRAQKQHREAIEGAIYMRGVTGWIEDRGVDREGNPIKIPRFSDKCLLAYARRHVKAYRDAAAASAARIGVAAVSYAASQVSLDPETMGQEAREHLRALLATSAMPTVTDAPVEASTPTREEDDDADTV